jgi:hypothetical protein
MSQLFDFCREVSGTRSSFVSCSLRGSIFRAVAPQLYSAYIMVIEGWRVRPNLVMGGFRLLLNLVY